MAYILSFANEKSHCGRYQRLISAMIGVQGPSRAVLRNCLTRVYNPLISNTLFLEYGRRSPVVKLSENDLLWTPGEIRELLNAFYHVCQWVPIYYLWRPNLRDEGDNFLIELAVAGNASAIVTNNVKDLKGAELIFPDIHILRPEELLGGK